MILEHPLFFTLLTLIVFKLFETIYIKSGNLPFLNPVLMTILCLVLILIKFDISYAEYKDGTELLHMLLAPAIVALAVPLYQNLQKAKELLPLVLFTIVIAGTGIISSAVLLGLFVGLPDLMVLALSTKSITAPIALEIAQLENGSVPLTIIGVFSTGLIGVIIVPFILNLLKVKDEAIQGLVLGMTAHAFGIARALSISPVAAAFATIGMGLMGCFAVICVPILLQLINL